MPLKDCKRSARFKTSILFQNTEVKLKAVEINMCNDWMKPILPRNDDNYHWDFNYSMGVDCNCSAKYDEICCYLVADLYMKGEKYFLIKLNTIHIYHTTKLRYFRENAELLKMMVKESTQHANVILKRAAGNSEYKGFAIPVPDDDELSEWAEWKNKDGYIPQPQDPHPDRIIPVLTNEQKQEYIKRGNELVKWIDNFDEKEKLFGLKSDRTEYYKKYAEWAQLSWVMRQYKMIARNHLIYNLINILQKMEKGKKKIPFNAFAREFYKGNKKLLKLILKDNMKDLKFN